MGNQSLILNKDHKRILKFFAKNPGVWESRNLPTWMRGVYKETLDLAEAGLIETSSSGICIFYRLNHKESGVPC